MALCSTLEVRMAFAGARVASMPWMAALSDSVPPLVKTSSRVVVAKPIGGRATRGGGHVRTAWARDSWPNRCVLEGLP